MSRVPRSPLEYSSDKDLLQTRQSGRVARELRGSPSDVSVDSDGHTGPVTVSSNNRADSGAIKEDMTGFGVETLVFKPKQTLWWKVKDSAFGYQRRVPCELIEMSRCGSKGFIRFQYRSRSSGLMLFHRRYVSLDDLEIRAT